MSSWCAPGKMQIHPSTGCVDLSQVVLSNGSGFIHPKRVCYLCGNTKGLKEPCAEEDCCFGGDEQGNLPTFHPTCARQAGLEVKDSSMMDFLFYGKSHRRVVFHYFASSCRHSRLPFVAYLSSLYLSLLSEMLQAWRE